MEGKYADTPVDIEVRGRETRRYADPPLTPPQPNPTQPTPPPQPKPWSLGLMAGP